MKPKIHLIIIAVIAALSVHAKAEFLSYTVESQSGSSWSGRFEFTSWDVAASSLSNNTRFSVDERATALQLTYFLSVPSSMAIGWYDYSGGSYKGSFSLQSPDLYTAVVTNAATWSDLDGMIFNIVSTTNATQFAQSGQTTLQGTNGTIRFSSVPEPSGVLLATFGSLFLLRRRKL